MFLLLGDSPRALRRGHSLEMLSTVPISITPSPLTMERLPLYSLIPPAGALSAASQQPAGDVGSNGSEVFHPAPPNRVSTHAEQAASQVFTWQANRITVAYAVPPSQRYS